MPEEKTTLDGLANMINQSFGDLEQNMNKNFEEIRNEIKELKRGQEEIKLKFAYVAWAIDLQELKERVEALEKKAKVKR